MAFATSRRRGFTSRRATNICLLEAEVLWERVGGLVLGAGAIGATEGLGMARRAFRRRGRCCSEGGGARIDKVTRGATMMRYVASGKTFLGGVEHHADGTGKKD